MDSHFSDDQEPLTAGDLLRSLSDEDYPIYILKLLNQVKGWLTQSFHIDGYDQSVSYDILLREDPEALYGQLKWLEAKVTLLPAMSRPAVHPEAVVLGLGEINQDDIMRDAVDYSLIFSRGECRRVWVISDCWIPFDVLPYAAHLQAMLNASISFRFLMITPWGWVELPITSRLSPGLKRFLFQNRSDNKRSPD